jgi:hypothetical protein
MDSRPKQFYLLFRMAALAAVRCLSNLARRLSRLARLGHILPGALALMVSKRGLSYLLLQVVVLAAVRHVLRIARIILIP